jgi:formylmethanofuran dehydrogenase subunit D
MITARWRNATVNTTYVGSWYNWLGNNEGDTGLLILSGGNILVEYVAADNAMPNMAWILENGCFQLAANHSG